MPFVSYLASRHRCSIETLLLPQSTLLCNESMESSSNPSTESDRFIDALDEFYYDCLPIGSVSHCYSSSRSGISSAASLRRRRSASRGNLFSSDVESEPSSFSNGCDLGEKSSDELKVDLETNNKVSDEIESSKERIDLSPEKQDDSDVINPSGDEPKDLNVADSDQDRVDPIQDRSYISIEKPEESTVTTASDDHLGDDDAGSESQLQEPNSNWSLLGFLAGLVVKTIEFQISMMINFITFPSWLFYCCSIFVFDPFSTISHGRSYLTTKVTEISDKILGTMNPFNLNCLKDTDQMLNLACKFGWGLFWAVYVGIVLCGLLVTALMLGGFLINRIADKPFVVKEILNFDYTKNSPEVYVPISSCAGVACDGSCKEINEMQKIRGLRVIPRDHKLEVTLSMTLPESLYNKNLGMFQVRVDFLSVDGQTLSSIRRPCMLKFRSEPIRLIQTFFKVLPLVTGYISEIQTLTLKLKGFVEKDIPTSCLKIILEQRAEFRPGAGIPELYDVSLSLESDLPFFKRIIWKWRKTLFVWISMCLFVMELVLTLVCCGSLIIPRARGRDSTGLNPTGS